MVGCGTSSATLPPTASPQATRSGPTPPPTATRPADATTSLQRIDEAAAAGTIDGDTATVFKLYAIFGDARLPNEYRGVPDPESGAGESFLREVRARFASMTPALQDAVGPFLVQPFYLGSWWDIQRMASSGVVPAAAVMAAAAVAAAVSNPTPTPPVPPCTPREPDTCQVSAEWTSIETLNGKVRIWYPRDLPGGQTQAERARSDIDTILWPELTALLGREPRSDGGFPGNGIDDRIDIAIVEPRDGLNPHVEDLRAANVTCQDTAGYVVLAPYERSLLAHEFAHLIQIAFPAPGGRNVCFSWDWIDEGVANWAAREIYPNDDSARVAARRFINQLEFRLDHHDDFHEYGTWLFFHDLARHAGTSIIGDIYDARASEADSLRAIDSVIPGGFAARWPEFARHAWNSDPVTSFREWVRVDTVPSPPWTPAPTIDLDGEVDQLIELEGLVLEPLSAWHLRFTVPPGVRSLGFYNGLGQTLRSFEAELGTVLTVGEAMPDSRGLRIEALLKINGAWQPPEDWTFLPYRHFCTDVAAERVEEIVFIVSNSEFADPARRLRAIGNPTTLFASNIGCARWEGDITWTWRNESGHETVTGRNLVFERDPTQVAPFGGGHTVNYMLTSGTLDWEYDFAYDSDCTDTGRNTGIRAETFHVFLTVNYVLTGPYYRAATATIRAEGTETITLACAGQPDERREHQPALSFPGGAAPDVIDDDGATIAGTYREGNLTTEWNLVAVRE